MSRIIYEFRRKACRTI